MNVRNLALGLGVFSIGLGVTELVAPGKLAKALGMKKRTKLVQLYGLREVATGIGLLSRKNKGPWVWARVVGDVADLATLGQARKAKSHYRKNAAVAAAAVAGVTALDIFCGRKLSSAAV
ncbi:hypothetical protein [Pelotalea chapellei]|uniref:Transcriptional regulator n=1 Tax=Pelotalea chapellei TaxID=44671 RepID=A0ABS5U5W9_9BACT|nr:hypothetical protein [Pelotalea chapellei]MBT1071057.1 hypothetical protein [Pelotalea chapellei]